ncbi:MAG: hypothetical protein VYA51_07925 [Planctomycetota bacterium]|nr:hypothetical protein [Planctomycetota bacterium]MEC9047926.1 hypothetical protein [Planctomycetota bacterium]
MKARRNHLTVSLLLLTAACASTAQAGAPERSSGTEHQLEAELRTFQTAQRVFRAQNIGQHEFDFEGHGRVTVREILLEGFPGGAYLKCRFHYQNRTPKPVVQSWVSLDVLDADGQIVSSQSCHLVVPTPQPIARGSYYAEELRTPTYKAHLQEGWSWRIRCDAELEQPEEPLDPPVERRAPGNLRAPVIIRNRGQNNG